MLNIASINQIILEMEIHMLRAVVKAQSEAVHGVLNLANFLFNNTVDLALLLFRLLAGSAAMPPSYEPPKSGEQLLYDIERARESRQGLHQDTVGTIQKYARASSAQRSTIDLSALHADARVCLQTMSEAELSALAVTRPRAIRLFALGKEHCMHGLPTVDLAAEPKVSTSRVADWDDPEALLAKQAHLLREMKAKSGASEFKMPAL